MSEGMYGDEKEPTQPKPKTKRKTKKDKTCM